MGVRMVHDLCLICGEEEIHLAWFTITMKNADVQAEVIGYLHEQGAKIRFGYLTDIELPGEVTYKVFTIVDEHADIEQLITELGRLDAVIHVEGEISHNVSLHHAEFPQELLGERAILLRATTFVDILKILNEHAPQSDTLLFLAGLRGGSNAAKYFIETARLERSNLIMILTELLSVCGWGRLQVEFDFLSLKGKIKVLDSCIADTFKRTESPVCSYMSGYFAGFFSKVLGENLYVSEIACKSTGSPYCEHTIYSAPIFNIEHLARGEGT
jgi:predicted hydrocarbon binding protein